MVPRRRSALLAAGFAVLLSLVLPVAPADAGARTGDGAHVVGEKWVGGRTLDLTVDSPALRRAVKVRLLVPHGWRAHRGRHWPTLYLLHGCCGDYTSWTARTDVADLTSDTGALVVMPEAGRVGFYSDWWNHGRGGSPAWERFHVTELRRLLERGYGAGSRRAVAGLSMGGLGAFTYVARHPHLFRAAASYSGVLDTRYAGRTGRDGPKLVLDLVRDEGKDPYALWGDPQRRPYLWAAHNPKDLAVRLRHVPLYLSAGDGRPGPLDAVGAPSDPTEELVGAETRSFVRQGRRLGSPMTVHLYGPGTHTWPYWQRELHGSFPMLMRAIGAKAV